MKQVDKIAKERYLERLRLIKSGGGCIDPFETKQQQQDRTQKAKSDPAYFVETYLKHYATSSCAPFQVWLARQVLKNKRCRFLVRWGRGLAKSVWCNIIIPLLLWINGENIFMVLVGNNFDKAKILLQDIQAEFEANELLRHDFGDQVLRGSWEDGDFRTKDGRFIAKALGMGQSPRGLRVGARRPNYISADDLEDKDTSKNPKRQDEVVKWIERDLIPTMDGDTRRYLHPNNNPFVRSIQGELEKRHPKWIVHEVKAYNKSTWEPAWKSKYNRTYYREVEEDIGVIAAYAEYLNEGHIEGKIFKPEQIQWVKLPNLNHFKVIAGHWDIAYAGTETSDYNAVRVWGLYDGEFYYIDSFVKQSKMTAALEWMASFQNQLPETVTVHWRFESQFWNDEVKRTIKEVEQQHNTSLGLIKVDTPKQKKYDRILKLQPYFQNGRIYYNEKKQGHNYTQTGLVQLYGIEPGYKTNDDAPDADEQAISWLEKHNRRAAGGVRTGKMRKNRKRRA